MSRTGLTDEQLADEADCVLRAAGSGMRHYTMAGTRAAILGAVEGIILRAAHRAKSIPSDVNGEVQDV